VSAQQHSPVARPTLLTGKEMKVEGTTNCGQAAESGRRIPDRPVAQKVLAWDDRSCGGNRSCREDERNVFAPMMPGRSASAHDDKEVI
jgi:hypothetical protein